MREILMYGDIGESWFGESVRAADVVKQLDGMKKEKEILVRINSGGGDVFEASAIYNALRTAGPRIITQNDAIAASAASYILMAGDEITVAENSLVMTHSPRVGMLMFATATDLRNTAMTLDKVHDVIVATYAKRVGDRSTAEKVASWVQDDETWFTAAEAIAAGLADKLGPSLNVKAQLRPWLKHAPDGLEPYKIDERKRAMIAREWELRLKSA
jgi:ATP-dependent Clp protease protease subunit